MPTIPHPQPLPLAGACGGWCCPFVFIPRPGGRTLVFIPVFQSCIFFPRTPHIYFGLFGGVGCSFALIPALKPICVFLVISICWWMLVDALSCGIPSSVCICVFCIYCWWWLAGAGGCLSVFIPSLGINTLLLVHPLAARSFKYDMWSNISRVNMKNLHNHIVLSEYQQTCMFNPVLIRGLKRNLVPIGLFWQLLTISFLHQS